MLKTKTKARLRENAHRKSLHLKNASRKSPHRRTVFRKAAAAVLALVLAASLFLGGCGSGDSGEKTPFYLYYRSADNLGAVRREGERPSGSVKEQAVALADALQNPDILQKETVQPLLPDFVSLNSISYESEYKNLTLDFSDSYSEMDRTTELLVRSCYVRTLTEIDGVESVSMTVSGESLTDSGGVPWGPMTASEFIENAGKSVNAYQNATITLYFSSPDGMYLVPEGRSIYYSSSKPLEWAIVERVIAGPKTEGSLPSVPGSTQVLSVVTQDRTCYINLSRTFLDDVPGVSPHTAVYAIADSVIRNCDVVDISSPEIPTTRFKDTAMTI